MFRRLSSIALLILLALPARADTLAQHFIAANPPAAMALFSFEDERGQTVNLREFRGRYVLINLWATWCGPCVRELPSLDALQNQFVMRRLMVVALAEDSNGLTAARAFYARHNIKHLTLYADGSGRAPALLHARGLPTSYLVDPQGYEVGRVEGEADWGTADSIAFLESKMKPAGFTAPSY